MNGEKNNLSNAEGMERTMLSHERTLAAWLRTSISLISFGFTIYKVFEHASGDANAPNRILTPRIAGMVMIALGLLALLLAQIQHYKARKELKQHLPQMQMSISSVLSILFLLFGLALFLGALFRQ